MARWASGQQRGCAAWGRPMAPALARLSASTRPGGWEKLRPEIGLEIGHRRRQPDNSVVWAFADPAGAAPHLAVSPGFNRSACGFGSFQLTRIRRTAIPRSAVRQRWATLSLQVLGAGSQFAGQRLGPSAHGAAKPGADHSHPGQQDNKMRLRTGTRAQPIACRCTRSKRFWRQRALSRTVGHGSHGSTISHSNTSQKSDLGCEGCWFLRNAFAVTLPADSLPQLQARHPCFRRSASSKFVNTVLLAGQIRAARQLHAMPGTSKDGGLPVAK